MLITCWRDCRRFEIFVDFDLFDWGINLSRVSCYTLHNESCIPMLFMNCFMNERLRGIVSPAATYLRLSAELNSTHAPFPCLAIDAMSNFHGGFQESKMKAGWSFIKFPPGLATRRNALPAFPLEPNLLEYAFIQRHEIGTMSGPV